MFHPCLGNALDMVGHALVGGALFLGGVGHIADIVSVSAAPADFFQRACGRLRLPTLLSTCGAAAPHAATTSRVSRCTASIMLEICVVASVVRSASLRTSSATTAKPRPCSPARAASMAAFSARRLVWSAMSPSHPGDAANLGRALIQRGNLAGCLLQLFGNMLDVTG